MRPKLPLLETMRDALASALEAARALGSATTLAFLVVLAGEAAHTVLVDPAGPVRFQPDAFLVNLARTVLLAPYWMAMFRRILGAGGSLPDIVAGRAGPFQAFLALELFWLLIGSVLGRALSPDEMGQDRAAAGIVMAGFGAWIAILILQIWTGMLAPALAVGAPEATLRGVFAMTRGAAARMALILVAAILPLGLLGRMLNAPERAGVDMPAVVIALRIVASSLLEMALLVLVTALLAQIYRRLSAPESLRPPRP